MKCAFLFSGQGAQYPGMMKDLLSIKAVKDVFDVADKVLERSISDLCFEGPQNDLNLTHNTQPCVLAADLAAYAAVMSEGIKPDAVAGFSLGEYAALVAADVLSIRDAFSLVQQRADFMQNAVPVGKGAMAAIMKLTGDEVTELCETIEGYVAPANYNCPGQIVVSGEASAIERLMVITKERRIRAMKLPVSAPFHCEMMNSASEELRKPLSAITFSKPSLPVYMNVDANTETSPDVIKEKLILQAKSPVRWEETLIKMYNDGIDTFVELGPGKTLSGFVRKTFRLGETVTVYNVTDQESLKTTISALRG